jgi:hypothetical protein
VLISSDVDGLLGCWRVDMGFVGFVGFEVGWVGGCVIFWLDMGLGSCVGMGYARTFQGVLCVTALDTYDFTF